MRQAFDHASEIPVPKGGCAAETGAREIRTGGADLQA
jgi:hypothetical protein